MRKTINQELVVSGDIHCKKLTWMLLHNSKELKEIEVGLTTLEGRKEVSNAAAKMFAERNILHLSPDKPYAMQCVDTEEAIENQSREYINGAAFMWKDCLCRPEYIRVYDKKSLGLFVVHMCLDAEANEDGSKKGKKAVKFAEDISKLSYQYYVLTKLGYNVTSCTIYYVNKEYEKHSSRHTWSEFLKSEEVIEHVVEHQVNTEATLEMVRELMETDEEPKCEGLNADRCINTPCKCFDRCKEEKNATNSIVWKLTGLYKSKKCTLVNAGMVTPDDILSAHYNGVVNLNEKQLRQLEFHIEGREKPWVMREEIEHFMKEAFENKRYAVFFDFESYMYVLPKFKNLQPYTQLPFQWSAHVLDIERMELKHYEFLGQKNKDPREACAKKMLELPHGEDTVWLAYNHGFEKGVIGKLAEFFPEMEEELLVIRESFRDLMKPFQHHWFYSNNFEGSYSIKYVLPGLFPKSEQLNYHNLTDIRNGMDAQRGYLQMQKKKGEELRELKKNMLAYCKLDTWAMVMLYGYMMELIARDGNTYGISEEDVSSLFTIVA